MKIDFLNILCEEITNAPKEMQPFVKDKDYLCSDRFAQTWLNYSTVYSHAVDVMAERVVSGQSYDKKLIIPLLYLVRQSIELSLKTAISHIGVYNNLDTVLNGHNLVVLFDRVQSLYLNATGYPTSEEWTAFCRKLIDHFAEFDPRGDRFRYPSNVTGDAFTEADVDLEGLLKAHLHITAWAMASFEGLEG